MIFYWTFFNFGRDSGNKIAYSWKEVAETSHWILVYLCKKISDFPVPSLFPARETFVIDISATDGKIAFLFLHCILSIFHLVIYHHCFFSLIVFSCPFFLFSFPHSLQIHNDSSVCVSLLTPSAPLCLYFSIYYILLLYFFPHLFYPYFIWFIFQY